MVETEFPFDVAFSFVQEDERLAMEVNDLLQDRLKTYIYSRQQGELAGTDGEKQFAEVFGRKARTVVVFLRQNWGGTRWTRIEMNAIKSRAFDAGYDFALFVPMEKPAVLPAWVPKTQIWFDLERWGSKGAAAVIEQRVRERGGESRDETVADRAARMNRRVEAEKKRADFRFSFEGVNAANAELETLFGLLESRAERASSEQTQLKSRRTTGTGRPVFVVWGSKISLEVQQTIYVQNNLEGSKMTMTVWKGPNPFLGGIWLEEPTRLAVKSYEYDMGLSGERGWLDKESGVISRSDRVADVGLKLLLDHIEGEAIKDHRR